MWWEEGECVRRKGRRCEYGGRREMCEEERKEV